ncbi:MAG: hypothetical protein M1834_001416 [Cirrosporium novae-zelandiae]|nr:MAG: hypothetical protein M1834_001416 [Cirrosporium novae-zelandiae]
MNGSAGGIPSPPVNGSTSSLSSITQALELVHSPRTSNENRQTASEYLETQKHQPDAPLNGFTLSCDHHQPPVVRHYGLSLIDYTIRHRWTDESRELLATLRQWMLALAQGLLAGDPSYIRNKIAQLWTEVAKRSWALDWMDMDEALVNIWDKSLVHKEFVLTVLESLSEDIFGREDTAAGLRAGDLNRACVEIFTPAAVLAELFPKRDNDINVRFETEGWLSRITVLLDQCRTQDASAVESVVTKALATLKSALQWCIRKAVMVTGCVVSIIRSLTSASVPVQLAAVEALNSLCSQLNFEDDEFRALVCPIYQKDTVSLIEKLYEWSIVDATNIDEAKYLLSKRLSEMLSNAGNLIDEDPLALPTSSDLNSFFNLLITVLHSQSLTVSIPVLHTWVRLLASESIGGSDLFLPFIGPLLDICSQRLVRYEYFPKDTEDQIVLFLDEDIESLPERHAFLGNYRRFCVQIIEIIVQRQPFEAFSYILGHVDETLGTLYAREAPFSAQNYTRWSSPVMRADAHLTVVEAALKGCAHWVSTHGKSPQQDASNLRNGLTHQNSMLTRLQEEQRTTMENNLEIWGQNLLAQTFEDPVIKQRIIKVSVDLCTQALAKKQSFALKVLEHLLTTQVSENPSYPSYSEVVRELQGFCSYEMKRLAIRYPDYFVTFYDQLEAKINEIASSLNMDEERKVSMSSVLFIMMHRSLSIDPSTREARLQSFVIPLKNAWQSPLLNQSLETFEGFCNLLRLHHLQNYMSQRQLQKYEDWSALKLDDEGRAMQAEVNEAPKQLPFKATKYILTASTEKLEKPSQTYDIACALWRDEIPAILPNLLKFLRYAHSFYNPENWTGLPEELRSIVSRVLTDRFWQSGISTESRDDFYAKISDTKSTVEGFASSVRSSIRTVREASYQILYCMSRFEEQFYGYGDLPEALANALFSDAHFLPSHQFLSLLSFARSLVDDCPCKFYPNFIPPYLIALFSQLDRKTSAEWESIEQRKEIKTANEDLTTEMRDESVLRQLTYNAVAMVASLLDPNQNDTTFKATNSKTSDVSKTPVPTLRLFIVSSPAVLEPVILFCTHALRMRDTRSCSIITRTLRYLIPEFIDDSAIAAQIREFISNEVLKACITSLHEPYFVDMQSDLAQLISTIWILYSPKTQTPRQMLLSLPGMTPEQVDRTGDKLLRIPGTRQQRALVLSLLDNIRGVSISELGKLPKPNPRKGRSAMQERYMKVDDHQRKKDDHLDLFGVAEMFGQAS